MSLLENAFEDFTVLTKTETKDNYGGTTVVWTDGTKIVGAMVYGNSSQVSIAQKSDSSQLYTLTVKKDVLLDFHTVVRRESDKKVFRLLSDSDDNRTPSGATLNMRQYVAEEWRLV